MVHPTNHAKTSTDRDVEEARVVFPNVNDTGLDVKDTPIVIVHNGLHHFVGAKLPQPSFKDGILDMCNLLQQARFIGDSLKAADPTVKGVVTTTSKTVGTLAYHLERLFKPPSPEELAAAAAAAESGSQPPAKRARHSSTETGDIIEHKSAMTRDGTTTMTSLHCSCGVRKDSKKDLQDHIKRHHDVAAGGSWKCAYENCKTSCKGVNPDKSLRKHVRNQHLNEYLYWCKYCENYGKDQKHLVINHIYRKHGMGQQLPCRNMGCDKMFPSLQSLKEHEQFCQEGKKYDCQFCTRKYKRVKNMKAHIKNMHTKDGAGKLLCTYCGRSYESMTTYKVHYTNNQCIKVLVPGMIEDVDPEVDEDPEDEEEEEEGGEGEEFLEA
ncbi:MAG: hypothetical protein MJE68_29430 [Proteobacteria bacterium]|nr:hypothetical protein [Pseudomonadota bacterium]